jgi:hypothetical protein
LKKLFAIALLSIYLFNLAGYTLLFELIEYRSDQKLIAYIDKAGFSDQNLLEIKVPLQLPYTTDWKDYERYDGEIEIGGAHYNYVKRKLSRDTLYLLCLPNEGKTQIHIVKDEYAKKVNDIPSDKESPNNLGKKDNTFCEYSQALTHFSFSRPVSPTPGKGLFVSAHYDQEQAKENWQPPEFLS